MITFGSVGMSSAPTKTTRSLLHVDITMSSTNETYAWIVYIPQGVDISTYLTANAGVYENDILRKEAEWTALDPKTRTIIDSYGQSIEVPILKTEIVKPTIPDAEEMMSDTLVELNSIRRLLTILTAGMISNTGITQQTIEDLTVIYPYYKIDTNYKVGEAFSFELKLYEVVQTHTSQANWYPPTTPALYKIKTPPGTIAEWIQPLGAQDAYQIGDKVTHNGHTWESTAANNVWEPGVYGWVQL